MGILNYKMAYEKWHKNCPSVIKNGFALFCYVIVTKQLTYPLSNMVDIG